MITCNGVQDKAASYHTSSECSECSYHAIWFQFLWEGIIAYTYQALN